jgi:hypothetical protein
MSSRLDAAPGAAGRLVAPRARSAALLHSDAAPWAALAALLILTGALLLHETRGTTILLDEWTWLLHRRGDSLSSFLASHDGHMSLIPVAIYKLLFATVGLRHSGPYRAVMISEHLAICALVFIYARPRVGSLLALAATTLILLFGPGWEDLLWSFQITWNTSLLAGLAALLALERRDRRGDVAACALLVISLASSGIGVPIVLGAALEVVLVRRRAPREWWVVGVPILLYAAWAVAYQSTIITRHALVAAPSFVATGLASTFGGLAGLGGTTGVDGPGTLMTWGPALLLGAVALAAWRLIRLGRLEPRVASLATTLLSFWVITAVNRFVFADPYSSRYLYVSALFVVLLAAELARGIAVSWWVKGLIVVLVAAAVISNFGALRAAGREVRADGQTTVADLGAVEIGRPVVPQGYVIRDVPGWPVLVVPAAAYFAASRAVPMLADTPAQIAAEPESVRETVDDELIHIHRLALVPAGPGQHAGTPSATPVPAGPGQHAGTPSAVDMASKGTISVRGGCVTFTPAQVTSAGGSPPAFAVTIPAAGVLIQSTGGSTRVAVRRFADRFQALGTLAGGGAATLVIAPDRSSRQWHLQMVPAGRALACGLG